MVVDEVDCYNSHQWLKPVQERVHTNSVCAKAIACNTVELRQFTAMNGAEVE